MPTPRSGKGPGEGATGSTAITALATLEETPQQCCEVSVLHRRCHAIPTGRESLDATHFFTPFYYPPAGWWEYLNEA